ncbi:hypothetical protein U5640_36190 [Streptomyces sp. SS7]|uniref:hypothetical protein n=1 Tax=Streptomyces sp. SS7 TaxID=3108485 RepID=UPI0030EDE182
MSSAGQELQPPAEAVLIRVARQARGLSPEEAAALLPIRLSGARWRQIENGYERRNPPKPVRAPDKTLAHMAHAVGVTPERLEEAGRPEAAEILREILRTQPDAYSGEPEGMSPRELEMLAGILASLAEGREMSPADMAATLRRAQEIIQERRRGRPPAADGSNAPPRSRAG